MIILFVFVYHSTSTLNCPSLKKKAITLIDIRLLISRIKHFEARTVRHEVRSLPREISRCCFIPARIYHRQEKPYLYLQKEQNGRSECIDSLD